MARRYVVVRLLPGPSAYRLQRMASNSLYVYPIAVVAWLGLLLQTWIPPLSDWVYKHAVEGVLVIASAYILVVVAFRIRLGLEIMNGYLTTNPAAIRFQIARESFVFVDEKSGIALARGNQIPVSGEGLARLKAQIRSEAPREEELFLVELPRYKLRVANPFFNWDDLSEPLYVKYLSKDSPQFGVDGLREIACNYEARITTK